FPRSAIRRSSSSSNAELRTTRYEHRRLASGPESRQSEQVEIPAARAVDSQLRHDLADDAAELEAVAGKPRRQRHLLVGWVAVDDEVFVRAVRKQARLHGDRWTVRVWEVRPDALAKHRLVLRVTGAIHS